MDNRELAHKSKHLSLVLRHRPESIGVTLTEDGYALVEAVLIGLRLTREELDQVVRENNKQRFELTEDGLLIRARQGHSLDEVKIAYDEDKPPEILYHGTSRLVLSSIREKGLLRMLRHHVHLTASFEVAQDSARRRKYPIVLRVWSQKMHEAGLKFYWTKNRVWLTDQVPPEYIEFPINSSHAPPA